MRGANPNGPRAQIKREAAEFGAKIITCFESYGRLTAFQVHELLGDDVKLSRVRQRLCRMVAEGDLHSELVKGEKSPSMAIYALGPSEGPPQKREQNQRIVRKWKPDGKPDPLALPAAFFSKGQP